MGPKGAKRGLTGSSGVKQSQMGSNGTKRGQEEQSRAKPGKTGQNGGKRGKTFLRMVTVLGMVIIRGIVTFLEKMNILWIVTIL